jgi:FkbM family methyltransferase
VILASRRKMEASLPLRLARGTRYLPGFRGLSTLLSLYRRFLPSDALFRVNDFDGDLKLDINICETIGINIWHTPRLFEKQEREVFCSAVTAGTVVLDVGANIGIYTLLAAKRGARVFAIEADPENARVLRHHIEINGFGDRVRVFEMAATDRSQLVTLYRGPRNSGGSTLFGANQGDTGVRIEGRTIDSLSLPPIDVCKMDIEGAEVMALRGMGETLARSPSLKLLIEWNLRVQAENLEQDGVPRPLLSLLRAHFASVRVVGGAELSASDVPPAFCNLWAHH